MSGGRWLRDPSTHRCPAPAGQDDLAGAAPGDRWLCTACGRLWEVAPGGLVLRPVGGQPATGARVEL